MISNIVFDLGKVLIAYDPGGYLERHFSDPKLRDRLMHAVFLSQSWQDDDAGKYPEEQILQGFIRNAPDLENEIRLVYEETGETIEAFPYAIPWLQSLAEKGYRLYGLSNYSKHTYDRSKQKLTFLNLLNGMLFSWECRLAKPDPAIYKHFLEKFSLSAETCIFIDDMPANIEAAQKQGFQGILFRTQAQARHDLDELLAVDGSV